MTQTETQKANAAKVAAAVEKYGAKALHLAILKAQVKNLEEVVLENDCRLAILLAVGAVFGAMETFSGEADEPELAEIANGILAEFKKLMAPIASMDVAL